MCDRLIVAVSTDELVESYKGHKPVIPFEQRIEIVRSIRYVDGAIRRDKRDLVDEWSRIDFNKVFVGDDWVNDDQWRAWERELDGVGVDVVWLPRTPNISSTIIKEWIAI
jgi:glycerol-3-phosphate cytidylyltransferase